jgi:hypothetical protein
MSNNLTLKTYGDTVQAETTSGLQYIFQLGGNCGDVYEDKNVPVLNYLNIMP